MSDLDEPRCSPKRSLAAIDEVSPSKRQRLPYHHHHTLQYKPQIVSTTEPALLIADSVDVLLIQSIKTICEEEARKQEISDPIIESVALESFRNAVEEFTLQLCAKVRRSMLAARRTTPIATDFETAIDVLDIPRLDDQLSPYHIKSDINPPLLPTPPPEDEFHDNVTLPESFLGSELGGQGGLKKFAFSITSLPALPSAHTYKDTAVFPHRETDSRKIRELATEEGKLGEQALRKLAGAVKLDAAHPVDMETKKQAAPVPIKFGRRRRKPDKSEEAVFEETMRELLKAEPGGFELGPIVSSEKAYRMPDDAQIKRRPVTTGTEVGSGVDVGGGLSTKTPARSSSASEIMDL